MALYWNTSTMSQTGLFRCEIPDACGVVQNVFVRAYYTEDEVTRSTAVAGTVIGILFIVVFVLVVLALIIITVRR